MDKIQKTSRYLGFVFNALLIIIPFLCVIEWTFFKPALGERDTSKHVVGFLFEKTIDTPEGHVNVNLVQWTPSLKCLAFGADFLGLLPFLLSLLVLKALFKNYQNGLVFSIKNAIYYRRLGILFLLNAFIIQPLSHTLMVLAVTANYPPGHRYLTISFGTPNLSALFYGFLVVFVSWVMYEASKLYEEQQFTI